MLLTGRGDFQVALLIKALEQGDLDSMPMASRIVFSSGDVNPIATADSMTVVAAGIRILFNISNARLRAVDSETERVS